METFSRLMPSFWTIADAIVLWTPGALVFVASYRRNRLLFGKTIPESVLIGVISGFFVAIWLIVWFVNREDIDSRWRDYRAMHEPGEVQASR